MRQWLQDHVEHPVRWGIVLLVHFFVAIRLGVEDGWILGVLYAFVLPFFLVVCFFAAWVGSLGVAVAVSAVALPFYAIPCAIGLILEWIGGLILNARERRKRRKQAQAICRRCGLQTDALTVEEALALSEEDIQTISWAVYKSNQATAERIAHVLADPAARRLTPDVFTNLQDEAMKDIRALRTRLLIAAAYHIRGEGWDIITDLPCMDWLCNSIYGVDLSDTDCVDILDAYSRSGVDAADNMAKERSVQNAIAHDFLV